MPNTLAAKLLRRVTRAEPDVYSVIRQASAVRLKTVQSYSCTRARLYSRILARILSVDRSAGAQTTPHACDAELCATVFLIYQIVFHNRNSHARMHGKNIVVFSESGL